MAKYYYKKKNRNFKLLIRLTCLGIIIVGAVIFSYIFFPLISWQIYFAPTFASQKIDAPIPANTVINPTSIGTLISNAATNINRDYTNAYNWYPGFKEEKKEFANYKISIPRINIENAIVTNQDSDLSRHLVQFNSDTMPPNEGNSIIFGHSTLPQLYDPANYKTIFANAYKLNVGDMIIVSEEDNKYNYKIESVTVVDPADTSVLAQNFSDSFITIITCTPPGTLWKRLIIKARLESN